MQCVLRRFKRLTNKVNNHEILSFGNKNPDKTFYVIYREAPLEGLFSYVNNFVWHIDYAINNGWIPIIDMRNYRNTYLDEEKISIDNSYEYYFKQPYSQYSIDEVYNSHNVILSNGEASPVLYTNRKNIVKRKWNKVAVKNIILNETSLNYIENEYKKIVEGNHNILGVNVRGTDYVSLGIKGLPKQPKIETLLVKAKNWMKKYNCNKIFLCCDDENTVEQFRNFFGEDTVLIN